MQPRLVSHHYLNQFYSTQLILVEAGAAAVRVTGTTSGQRTAASDAVPQPKHGLSHLGHARRARSRRLRVRAARKTAVVAYSDLNYAQLRVSLVAKCPILLRCITPAMPLRSVGRGGAERRSQQGLAQAWYGIAAAAIPAPGPGKIEMAANKL